jgi:FkbM family methyltransferase
MLNSWDVPTFIEVFADGEYTSLTKMAANDVKFVVDCGANVGLFANWCTFHFPNSHTICHEPVTRNRTLGLANTLHLQSVTWQGTAVSNHTGTVKFTDEGPGSTMLWDGYSQDVQNDVKVIDLIDEYKDCQIDILKMDIEGSEQAILGDDRFLTWSKRVRCIALEWHNHGLIDDTSPCQWYLERLRQCGFSVSSGNSHGDWSGLIFGTRS